MSTNHRRAQASSIALLSALSLHAAAQAAAPPEGALHVATPKHRAGAAPALPIEALKALVPAQVGGWRRLNMSVPFATRLPSGPSPVEAEFERGTRVVTLTIGDVGEQKPGSAWAGPPLDRTTSAGSEKIYADGGHTVREELDRVKQLRQVTITLANGVAIVVSGVGAEAAELKELATGIDLARAAAITRPAR